MFTARDLIRFTKLGQAIKDNDVNNEYDKKGVYNKKEPKKSFVGNVKSVKENGLQWYNKRFPEQGCCNIKNVILESGFSFCRKCGFLYA